MNEELPIPTCNSTPTTKIPKLVNEVSEVRLDDELEALCQDTEYPLSDLKRGSQALAVAKRVEPLWSNMT